MAEHPDDLRYTTDHEWVRIDGDLATVGITDFAQDSLGDIVFVSLPEPDAEVQAGAECGEIESTKSVSALVAPVSGAVTEINTALDAAPEAINSDPYGDGWMFQVRLADPAALPDTLLTAEQYREQIS